MTANNALYRADIQGLRAVAVILVVLAHAGAPGFGGGYIGVDVFFVISGYLITRLLVDERRKTGRINYLAFLAKRLKRLLPALLVMLIVVTALGWLLLTGHEFSEQTRSAPYAAIWSSNFYFAFTSFDYFAELRQKDLYLHTWSLGVEEQFYLLWPALIALALFSGSSRTFQVQRRIVTATLCSVFAASFLLSLYWSGSNNLLAFYMTPARAWEFALGGLVYLYTDARPRPTSGLIAQHGRAIQTTGLLLITGVAMTLPKQVTYSGAWILIPAVGAALTIAGGTARARHEPHRLLSHQMLTWVGDRSYSWYLWHWPLLMIGFAHGLEAHALAIPALIMLSLLVSSVSYERIELPFWKGRYARATPATVLLASSAVITGTSVVLAKLNSAQQNPDSTAALIARSMRNDMPSIYRQGCDRFFQDDQLTPCFGGPDDASRTVALIGDSIAAQWYSLLPSIYGSGDWRLVTLTKSSCAMVEADNPDLADVRSEEICRNWRREATKYLADLKPDVLFIGNSARYAFTADEWVAGTRSILDLLAPVVGRIVVLEGTPQLSFDGPSCLERWFRGHDDHIQPSQPLCADHVATSGQQARASLTAAAASYSNVQVLQLSDIVCPNSTCAAWDTDGYAVFRDRQHLTDTFVRQKAAEIKARLGQMGVPID